MARGRAPKREGRGAPSGSKSKAPPKHSFEDVDDMDEVLGLNEDPASEASSSAFEDEPVMALSEDDDWDEDENEEGEEGEDPASFKAALRNAEAPAKDEKKKKDKDDFGTVGWKGQDFYGGEEAGGSSDGGSDEEMNFQEAKRLEDLRAQRLGMSVADPLAMLMGDDEPVDATEAAAKAAAPAAGAAAAAARFESVFDDGAEHGAVERDLATLPEHRRKKLVKSEAPELVPLLSDYKEKLASLKELLPLLAPGSAPQLPPTGGAYLDAKLSLLLSTLVNLSYYILLRAEGGEVRTHPVVSQLVWLRELHEKLTPMDKQLKGSIKRALATARGASSKKAAQAAVDSDDEEAMDTKDAPRAPRKLGIRERLQRLRAQSAPLRKAGAQDAEKGASRTDLLVSDLLRLPGRKKDKSGAGSAPADLNEVDPTVGVWNPNTTLGQEVLNVQQYVSGREKRNKEVPADTDVEPRKRAARMKVQDAPVMPDMPKDEAEFNKKMDKMEKEQGDENEPEAVKEARAKTKVKKEIKAQREKNIEEARLLRQYHPEEEQKGHRKISARILKNRGLIRSRGQTTTARVGYRKKYDKFITRRKGAVREMREGAADGASYEGESTGMRTNLRKSLKLSA